MNAGSDTSSDVVETITKDSAIPVVVGVDFFDSQIFKQNRARLVAPVFSATGQTSARAISSNSHQVLWTSESGGAFGEDVELFGDEHADENTSCPGNANSDVTLRSKLAPSRWPAPQLTKSREFEFITEGSITGGISGFQPRCEYEPVKTEAHMSFQTAIETTIRSNKARILLIDLQGGGTKIRAEVQVQDWTGRLIHPTTTRTHRMLYPDETETQYEFPLRGAGVYQARVSGEQVVSVAGEKSLQVFAIERFTLVLLC